MNTNFAKLVAVGIIGGVIKALFAPPSVHNHYNTEVNTPSADLELVKDTKK